MKLEMTYFSLSAQDTQMSCGVTTDFNESPTAKMALDRFRTVFGIIGIERFLDLAMERESTIEINICDEYGNFHEIEFDPYDPVHDGKFTSDLALLVSRIGICIEGFLRNQRKISEDEAN